MIKLIYGANNVTPRPAQMANKKYEQRERKSIIFIVSSEKYARKS